MLYHIVPFYQTKIEYIECHLTNQMSNIEHVKIEVIIKTNREFEFVTEELIKLITFQCDLKDCLCSLIFKKRHKINNLKGFSLDDTYYKWCYLNFVYTSVLFVNPVSKKFPSVLLVHFI